MQHKASFQISIGSGGHETASHRRLLEAADWGPTLYCKVHCARTDVNQEAWLYVEPELRPAARIPISLYQAIQRTPFDELHLTFRHRWLADPLRLAKLPALVTVISICAMTLGVLTWGLLACIHVPSTLLSYFGPLHTTALVSWLASAAVFIAASAITLPMSSTLSTSSAT